jgi:transposase
MSSRGTYLWHSSLFKILVCQEIRIGGLLRRGTQERYSLLAYLIQHWLVLYDLGELVSDEAEAAVLVEYPAKIAARDCKVGQLPLELDLHKKNTVAASRQQQRECAHHQWAAGLSVRQGCEVVAQHLPLSTGVRIESAG